ncbi:MAG: hypothetical protein AAFN07_01920 [Pseudomonadota bacterium]
MTLAYQSAMSLIPVTEIRPTIRFMKSGFFFGFHDKTPWCPNARFLLAHRVPKQSSKLAAIEVGYFDLESEEFCPIGDTDLWNYQQGSDLQWVGDQVLYNTRINDQQGATLFDISTSASMEIEEPVSAVAANKSYYASYCFRRLSKRMPGYGYACSSLDESPRATLRIGDFTTKSSSQVVFEAPIDTPNARHFICQPQFSPSGTRLVFFLRTSRSQNRYDTQVIVLNTQTGTSRRLDSLTDCSHYTWVDEQNLFAFGKESRKKRWEYLEVDTQENKATSVGWLSGFSDGHPQACSANDLLVTDSYPDRNRLQRLMIVDRSTKTVRTLADLRIPLRFYGANRCDFHPRWSPDGRHICIDSAHTGERSVAILALDEQIN